MSAPEDDSPGKVEFSMEESEDCDALYRELRGLPGVHVEAVPAKIASGDQGSVLEFLTVACSGGAITVVLEIVKALVESRGPKFSLRIRRGRDRLEMTADNLDEVLPVLRELLDGS
jgi:hypothetical protein